MTLTLTNNFHNTTSTITTSENYFGPISRVAVVSDKDFNTAQKELCGMDDCCCDHIRVGVDVDDKEYTLLPL